jgi:Tfp pilus assembly protein PilF
MRQAMSIPVALAAAIALSACSQSADESVERALQETVNVVDESDLNDVILNSTDPNEAVRHFQRSLVDAPDRIDLQRGLAHSLIRAKRFAEGKLAWQRTVTMPGVTHSDRVNLADALIRTNDWDAAKAALDKVPPTYETFQRYRLEAVVADSKKDWERADSFYETAVGLTTTPGSIFNNWGYSKLTRGDFAEAERMFGEALRQQPDLFTAKNNLVLARGAQRNYTLPVLRMDQTERAQLLYTLALSAVKQGDTNIGEGLLREAVNTHPQHFEAAAQALQALEQG